MPERDNVIKGLNSCAKWMKENDGDACNSCPYHSNFSYDDNDCISMVNSDAIALLKEQEPRVLTLEEAKTYEVVWPEDKGEGELHPLIVRNNMNDSKYYKYGIHWRVWSAKPTDEQRKAVKWDD